MNETLLPRREFLEMLAGAFAAPAIDWQALPSGLECFAEITRSW